MLKRFDSAVLLLVGVLLISVVAYTQLLGVHLPRILGKSIGSSVGNKAAPIPVLDVTQIKLTDEKNLSSNQVKSSISSSVGGQGISPKYDLKEYQLSWMVTVENGTLAPVKAQVFIPTKNDQQYPVIIYGAGSTGLDDRCAPSREDLKIGNMGNYRNYMISEASQGYIVVMPNYEGFDNPKRTQHYFNKDNEARSMLSAAKAMVIAGNQNKLPLKPNAVFLGGYSQGGHATFSAADYAARYAPDLKIAGIYSHGPTTNIAEYLKSNPNLAAYFIESYSEYYPAIDPSKILEPEWIGYLDRAKIICVNEGFGINSTTVAKVFADPFEAALRSNSLAVAFPEVNAIFEENNAGTSYTGIPTMIVQGGADPIVTPKVQDAFVDQLCQRGVRVDLKSYPGLHHFSTRQKSFKDTNAWIDAISLGQPTNNSCDARL